MDEGQLSLLNVEEVDKLYYSGSDTDKRKILLFCSDELKLKEVTNFGTYDKEIFDFIMSFKDGNKGKLAYYNYLKHNNIDINSLIYCFGKCNVNYRGYFVDLVFEYLEKNPDYEFNLYNISNLLKLFDVNYMEQLLDRLLGILESRVVDKKISSTSLYKIVNLFPNEKRIEIFNKFVELYKKNKLESMEYNFTNILKDIGDKEKFQFLNSLLENDLLSGSYYISEVLAVFSDEEKDEVLKFIQEYEVESGKEFINFAVIAACLGKYNPDIRLEKFRNLVMNNEKYSHFDVINNLRDVNFKFESLNLKVSNLLPFLKEEKKQQLFNILNIIVNSHFDRYGDKFPDSNVSYGSLLYFYVDYLGLNKTNLVKFIERFGYVSLRYLDNNNVRNVINLDSDKFDLFMNLFRDDNIKLDNDTYNTVINAILQREFMVQCKDDYNIFSRDFSKINLTI